LDEAIIGAYLEDGGVNINGRCDSSKRVRKTEKKRTYGGSQDFGREKR